MPAVSFTHVDVIFGPDPPAAIKMLDRGADRDEIFTKTQNLVAVQDATLDIAAGQICVLMGLSGSGKSSLIRCVNGLNKVSRGRVLVHHGGNSIDVTRCDRAMLHRLRTERISMVFQQFALLPWRTVGENVGFGLELSGMPKEKVNRIVNEKLALVRLNDWIDKYPSELSGGMQQRVGLARALATEADILLMDEPFSALDPLIRQHLQVELTQLQHELKKTIVFVSHDLDEALKLGSIIAIMDAGQIVQTGTPEDIVSRPVNDYVRQFVASMNPLNVLKCASLMRPISELKSVGGSDGPKALDPERKILCTVDKMGRPTHLTHSGSHVSLIPFRDDLDLKTLPRNVLVAADVETPMRAAVEINYVFGLPMPVIDQIGRLIGVVGAPEIFGGILRESEISKKGLSSS